MVFDWLRTLRLRFGWNCHGSRRHRRRRMVRTHRAAEVCEPRVPPSDFLGTLAGTGILAAATPPLGEGLDGGLPAGVGVASLPAEDGAPARAATSPPTAREPFPALPLDTAPAAQAPRLGADSPAPTTPRDHLTTVAYATLIQEVTDELLMGTIDGGLSSSLSDPGRSSASPSADIGTRFAARHRAETPDPAALPTAAAPAGASGGNGGGLAVSGRGVLGSFELAPAGAGESTAPMAWADTGDAGDGYGDADDPTVQTTSTVQPDGETMQASSSLLSGSGGGSASGGGSGSGGGGSTNNPPVAVDDEFDVPHNFLLEGNVMHNNGMGPDYDPDPLDAPSANLASDPSHGTLTYLNSDGWFEYVPHTDYVGLDSFTYTVSDGIADSPPATVTIDVYNTPPSAAPDGEYGILQNVLLEVPAAEGVLVNDSDFEGDSPLTSVLYTQASHGTVSLSSDGSFTYDPQPSYFGPDEFEYRAFDGWDYSLPTTVALNVTPPRIVPDGTDAIIVGQHVSLSVELPNAPENAVKTYQWSIAGDTVEKYEQSFDQGVVTELTAADLDDPSVSFYWIDGGEKTVSVTVTVNGRQVTASETFTVLRPGGLGGGEPSIDSDTTSDQKPVAVGDMNHPDEPFTLHFGSYHNLPDSLGIRWFGTAIAPAGGDGKLGFVQLVYRYSEYTYDNGDRYFVDSEGWVLDALTGQVLTHGKSTPITAEQAGLHEDHDNPYGPVVDELASLYHYMDMELYFMYRPSGQDSIWVTLATLDWGWNGYTEQDLQGNWSDPDPMGYWVSPSVNSTQLPVWTENSDDLKSEPW